MSEQINLKLLPVSWFPDLAAVLVFLQGPRYKALCSLALGVYNVKLPEPLATEARQAGFFVGQDLLELGRYAALSSPETFEAQREDGEWSGEWSKWLSMLGAVALAGNFVEEISAPLLEMQSEAEAERKELLVAKAEAKFRVIVAERAERADA